MDVLRPLIILKFGLTIFRGCGKTIKSVLMKLPFGKVTGIEYTDSGNYLVSVAIEELRRQLEKIGKEEELKFVEQKMETISARL